MVELKHFDNFLGYNLSTGCRHIAIISSVISIAVAILFISANVHDVDVLMDVDKEKNPDFSNYGSINAFNYVTMAVGCKEMTHFIVCMFLFFGSKTVLLPSNIPRPASAHPDLYTTLPEDDSPPRIQDNTCAIRFWLRSNVIGLCIMGVFGTYTTILLFAANSPQYGVLGLFILIIYLPMKIYFGLVVNSYHNLLDPHHIWGDRMRIDETYDAPTSCTLVPPIQTNQPAVVVISV